MSLLAVIYFAGGCFWGVEEYFSRVPGVVETEAGYAQSLVENPDYRTVCGGDTGAVETVRVSYDPAKVSLETLVGQFLKIIDPFAVNRQGNDVGTQYASGIFYVNAAEKKELRELLDRAAQKYGRPLAVRLEELRNFYPAEEYHQDYLKKNPGGYCHINFDSLADLKPRYVKPAGDKIKKSLTPEQFHVTQQCGTEPPFSGKYWDNHVPGVYVDVVTGEPLFLSIDKFDSGTGWPSFTRPLDRDAVREQPDNSHGMQRVEVRSSIGDSHLGHVFDDGPVDSGGRRYCINSAALRFVPYDDMEKEGYGYLLPRLKK